MGRVELVCLWSPNQITLTKKHQMVTLTQLRTAAQTLPHLQAQPADTYTGTVTDNLGLTTNLSPCSLPSVVGRMVHSVQSPGSKDDIECHLRFSINPLRALPQSIVNNIKLQPQMMKAYRAAPTRRTSQISWTIVACWVGFVLCWIVRTSLPWQILEFPDSQHWNHTWRAGSLLQ